MMVAGGAAAVLGPSLGEWYAGKGFMTGLGLRVAGAAIAGAGAASFVGNVFNEDQSTAGASLVLGIAGLATIAVGTALDIRDASGVAAAYNRRHAAQLSLAPIVTRQETGMAIVGTF